MTQKTVKIALTLTESGQFDIDANGGKDVTKLDQCRTLMLGIYAITRDELGVNPDVITLTSLADWAEEVIG